MGINGDIYFGRWTKKKQNCQNQFWKIREAKFDSSLAGYYTTFGSRPLPEKLTKRLKQEFRQVEFALKKGY